MKKNTILLLLLLSIACIANAQQFKKLNNSTYTTLHRDTATNTGVATLDVDVSGMKGDVCTVCFTVTKISGTVAGTVQLEVNAGTFYGAIDNDSLSFTATNVASQSRCWILRGQLPSDKLRITHTGSGTMASYIEAEVRISR